MAACSIIIAVHASAPADLPCLRALAGPARPAENAIEIILSVYGEGDMRPRVPAVFADRVRLHRCATDATATLSGARRAGAAVASAPILVFLDADAQPEADWLDALLRHAQAHPRAAAIGSKRLRPDGTVHDAGIAMGHDRWPRPLYTGFPSDHAAVNRPRPVPMLSAASLLVLREAFDAAGGFDPELDAAYADHDLCLRLGELGHAVHYCHTSVAVQPARAATHAADASDAARIARARQRFRLRWADRVQPDDLTYYVDDGLLRWRYVEGSPLPVLAFPMLNGPQGARDLEIYRRLIAEAQAEGVDRVKTAQSGLVPPQALVHLIGGAFEQVGEEFLQYFVELGGLRPSARVLDVGCGAGRLAVPLTTFLDAAGRYEGFDVMADAVAWCRDEISSRYPNFRFQHVDLSNTCYNPSGRQAASNHRFPYPAASFDFACSISVFTHMLPDAVRHYLAQIAAVLQPGGRCLSTFFLLNAEAHALIRAGASTRPFADRHPGYATDDPAVPEHAVAHDEAEVREMYRAYGLTVEQIRYGTWAGRLGGLSYQDIVLAVKA